jgi:drug/metabolite transporter (DMT)-like permease
LARWRFLFLSGSAKSPSALTRTTLLLAILGGIALVVNWLLLFAAYERISIGLSTVVYNTQPFMLVLMGMLLGERVSLVKWGWLFLAFGGVVILLSSELTGAHGSEWLAGIGWRWRGFLLCADGHHRPQAASAPHSILPLFRCSSAS